MTKVVLTKPDTLQLPMTVTCDGFMIITSFFLSLVTKRCSFEHQSPAFKRGKHGHFVQRAKN